MFYEKERLIMPEESSTEQNQTTIFLNAIQEDILADKNGSLNSTAGLEKALNHLHVSFPVIDDFIEEHKDEYAKLKLSEKTRLAEKDNLNKQSEKLERIKSNNNISNDDIAEFKGFLANAPLMTSICSLLYPVRGVAAFRAVNVSNELSKAQQDSQVPTSTTDFISAALSVKAKPSSSSWKTV